MTEFDGKTSPQQRPRVLHINVRLSEGGAAQIARDLVRGMPRMGYQCYFAYGYGPHGGASADQTAWDADRLTSRAYAAANRSFHQAVGIEFPWTPPTSAATLKNAIAESDLVHLHVVHSYMMKFSEIVKTIRELGKPVIWTLHDQWILTGRCAQPGDCERWKIGCGACPSLSAYPPASLDFTRSGFRSRRKVLKFLEDSVPVRYIACADWLRREAEIAGFRNVGVINNSVEQEFWLAAQTAECKEPSSVKRVVFVCRDLRDPVKVKWDILAAVASAPGIALTIIGDNPPCELPGATYKPSIQDRRAMAYELSQHDTLLFTSGVDYYPLTVAEALVVGLRVVALESRAANEFRHFEAVTVFSDVSDAVAAIESAPEPGPSRKSALDYFSPQRMLRDYADEYAQLLKARA